MLPATDCARPDFSHSPLFLQELEEVQRTLAGSNPWPAILSAKIWARSDWNDGPENVVEALEWMATIAVGLLDVASVNPLMPIVLGFAALIEAAEGTPEVAENLGELIAWCSFLVGVFIEHGKRMGDLTLFVQPMDQFVFTTREFAKRFKV